MLLILINSLSPPKPANADAIEKTYPSVGSLWLSVVSIFKAVLIYDNTVSAFSATIDADAPDLGDKFLLSKI